ncbi:GntR family transcriptional regulator [Paracoccus sp. (in: a-proteobacteria)]|uniref:GntR family transcriptional regulator n=1 Tax=Paracoccus sp. TaxID=267 RepID=UPI00321FAA59
MQPVVDIQTKSLSSQVYLHLRQQLMSARYRPGDRLKIRDLAQGMGTSETPVREALLQLVKDGALEMKPGYYIRVRQVNLQEYLEIRKIRQLLEPYAALQALPNIDDALIDRLAGIHETLIQAERDRDYPMALQANYDFHFTIYRLSHMPHLIEILERLWIQIGSLLTLLYPHGHPTYDGDHQHLNVLKALRRRDPQAISTAIESDLMEGGRNFLSYLEEIERAQNRDAARSAEKAP